MDEVQAYRGKFSAELIGFFELYRVKCHLLANLKQGHNPSSPLMTILLITQGSPPSSSLDSHLSILISSLFSILQSRVSRRKCVS